MTKDEITSHLGVFGHPEMVIQAGAAAVLHGLRTHTADIDAVVDEELFEVLWKKDGEPKCSTYGSATLYTIPGSYIDLHKDPGGKKPTTTDIEGVVGRIVSVEELFKFYKRLNRPKDQELLNKLREFTLGRE